VQSVERTFALLEALGRSTRPLGVSELAVECDLSLATIHRLLRTLVDLGYVRQEPSRTYALGPGLLRLGERAASGLTAWSRPLLEGLVRELGESVNLATLDGDRVVYLAHVPSSRSMRMFTEVGARAAAHATGVGKAMLAELAQLAPDAARDLLARTDLEPLTEHTITDPDELAEALRTAARQGYALDDEEQEVGVRCVAVAVPGSRPQLAVSTSGPTSRMSDDLVARAVPLLQGVAAAIADEMRRSA
jgi:IclR family acetate operon transcriptional repressor